ncbi:MAG TPA: 2-amino-4-hydroxy-6-hydroxymethyldihydropteridine diphosphokinase [Chryseolinea sp.]|jgi:2-amino-4-hydroxy-6-hydroxymethyldihydropteridine diphosphokinase|nr:2-amino-4-hydroxy-6-hydroxymethyldihydropteridine diphosphokinase [Chryseolinea sp.]
MKKITFLLLGTNLGDRKKNLATARKAIEVSVGTILKTSSIYQTAAWGKTDQPDFLNQALEVQTALPAENVLAEILKIEHTMGRTRDEHWGERIIDIDILLFEKEMISSTTLEIPHPKLANRRFALEPLAEIGGDVTHPGLQLTIREMLEQCPDVLEVRRILE